MSSASSDTSFADFFCYFLSHLASLTLSLSPLPCSSTLFNARTATCCALIGLCVLCKALHSHARLCAANSEANYSQHYVRNPCTILRSEFFKRVILCFLSCEVCHALTCFIPCYDRLHSLQCTHRRMLRSDWSTRPLQRSTFPCTTLRCEF